MMNPRFHQSAHDSTSGSPGQGNARWDVRSHDEVSGGEEAGAGQVHARLNLLLSYGGWREESAVNQLPRLLEPLGIRSYRVHSGEEATEVITHLPVHIAVVDLAIPLHRNQADAPSGPRILTLLRRLDQPPPTVVLRPPQPAARESVRSLSDALREGAFAVLDRPVDLEIMLEVMRRVLRRYYADHWPHC